MRVTILRGIAGSGKSTLAKRLYPTARVFSTDHYFTSTDGSYAFNPAELGKAHGWCLRTFASALELAVSRDDADTRHFVVDNTNTSVAELAPYAALALAQGCEVEVVTVPCDPRLAVERNVHGVPALTIGMMHATLMAETPRIPAWWNPRTLSAAELEAA